MGGQAFLKAMNGRTAPRNTMKPGVPIHDAQPISSAYPREPATKKQRRSSVQSSTTTSHFFSRSKDDIQESIDDIYEIRSNSSVGQRAPGASATQDEFRKVQPKKSAGSGRVRRSRQSQGGSQAESPISPPSTMHFPKTRGSNERDSPDCLVEDPPPANVTSDLGTSRSSTKRGRTGNDPQPSIKRVKANSYSEAIEDSEDELQASVKLRERDAGTSKPKPSSFSERTHASERMRGDIRPTQFGASQTRPRSAKISPISVNRAVSGRYYQESRPLQQTRLELLDEDECLQGNLITKAGKVKHLSWLDLHPQSIQNIQHADACEIIVLTRCKTDDQPSKLILEIEANDERRRLLNFMQRYMAKSNGGGKKASPISSDRLRRTFQKAQEEADNHAAQNGLRVVDVERISQPISRNILETQSSPSPQDQDIEHPRVKIVDKLLKSKSRIAPEQVDDDDTIKETTASLAPAREGRSTRRKAAQVPQMLPLESQEDGWTKLHPDWKEDWHSRLIYPATGRAMATVHSEDIPRLDEGEFMNDNLIQFYLSYLQLGKDTPDVQKKVYIFSSFFYDKLKSTRTHINYEGVKKWTAKVDLFSYDYVVVPVNENMHWYLAIICNPGKALPQPQLLEADEDGVQGAGGNGGPGTDSPLTAEKDKASKQKSINGATDSLPSSPEIAFRRSSIRSQTSSIRAKKHNPKDPRIITLDSLGSSHVATCKALKEYLAEEAKDKKKIALTGLPPGMTAKGLPEQDNFCDCGVFVLAYMEEFLQDPDEVARKLLQKEPLDWDIKPSLLRNSLRDLLFKLQKEQEDRQLRQKREKRFAKAKNVTSQQALPSSQDPGGTSPKGPQLDPPSSATVADRPRPFLVSEEDLAGQPSHSSPVKTPGREPISPFPASTPRLISRMSSSSRDQEEVYYSARSSPKVPPSMLQGDLSSGMRRTEPTFVEPLLSSDADEPGHHLVASRSNHTSPRRGAPLSRETIGSDEVVSIPSDSQVMPSIEDSQGQGGAQYDGVEAN